MDGDAVVKRNIDWRIAMRALKVPNGIDGVVGEWRGVHALVAACSASAFFTASTFLRLQGTKVHRDLRWYDSSDDSIREVAGLSSYCILFSCDDDSKLLALPVNASVRR